MTYQTSRLSVVELLSAEPGTQLLDVITELLTPRVVASLPPNFQQVETSADAQRWLDQMVSESRLFVVREVESSSVVGFVFVSNSGNSVAHIGYLLGESYWGRGYATELVKGLLEFIGSEGKVRKLIAGVATDNTASIKLLRKLGFVRKGNDGEGADFYEYEIAKIGQNNR